ncbi:short chain dehydrogenase, putative, partial [Plasmodium chabaudi chabaudi]
MNVLYKLLLCFFFIQALECYRVPNVHNLNKVNPNKYLRASHDLNLLGHNKENNYYCGENKVALVTGAGRGIGRSIAKTLAKSVSHVLCISKTQ